MTEIPSKPSRWFLPNRRWLQFRLRTLFCLVLLVSLPLGWLGMKLAHKRAERQNVESLRAMHAILYFRDEKGELGTPEGLLRNWSWFDSIGLGDLRLDVDYVRFESSSDDFHAVEAFKLAKGFPRLTYLLFKNCEIDDNSLAGIERQENLRALDLSGSLVSDASVPRLLKLRQLTTLKLQMTLLSDHGFEQLAELPHLQRLYVDGTQVSEAAVARFQVRRADVEVTWATLPSEAAVRRVSELARRDISIRVVQIESGPSPRTYVELPAAPAARDLELLETIPHLYLSFDFAVGNDKMLEPIANLELLESFTLVFPSDSQLLLLCERRSRLMELRIEQPNRMTNEGLLKLHWLPNLKRFALNESYLSFAEKIKLTQGGVDHIAAVESLEELELMHCAIENDALQPLAGLPHLRILQLHHMQLDEEQIRHLRNLHSLRELSLNDSTFDEKGREQLSKLQDLEDLSIDNTNLSDDDLLRLAALPRLKTLTIDATNALTPAGQSRFERARPDVRIVAPINFVQ